MSYRIDRTLAGRSLTCYQLVVNAATNECPADIYLKALEQENEVSHRAMLRRIKDHADNGQTTIWKHGHPVKGRQNLHVWKTKQGARILYFQLEGKHPVMVTGYDKGDEGEAQYDRAERLRDEYLASRGRNR